MCLKINFNGKELCLREYSAIKKKRICKELW